MFDRSGAKEVLDSLKKSQQDRCNEAINNAFNLGIETATREFAKIKIPVNRTDTLRQRLIDRQILGLVSDSLGKAERRIAALNQQGVDTREQLNERKKEASGWMWKAIITWIAVAVSVCLFLYFKFFK